jgi:hypothetical protein
VILRVCDSFSLLAKAPEVMEQVHGYDYKVSHSYIENYLILCMRTAAVRLMESTKCHDDV